MHSKSSPWQLCLPPSTLAWADGHITVLDKIDYLSIKRIAFYIFRLKVFHSVFNYTKTNTHGILKLWPSNHPWMTNMFNEVITILTISPSLCQRFELSNKINAWWKSLVYILKTVFDKLQNAPIIGPKIKFSQRKGPLGKGLKDQTWTFNDHLEDSPLVSACTIYKQRGINWRWQAQKIHIQTYSNPLVSDRSYDSAWHRTTSQ